MSDEQHPEIVDIGLPAVFPPRSESVLKQILAGLMVNIHDETARSMAREILDLREQLSHYSMS